MQNPKRITDRTNVLSNLEYVELNFKELSCPVLVQKELEKDISNFYISTYKIGIFTYLKLEIII